MRIGVPRSMICRIHRGAREIGGSCVELEAAGKRLVLDVGRPLTAAMDVILPLPKIAGLAEGHDSVVGVVISHGHPDHWGLASQLHPRTQVFTGAATERILREAAYWTRAGIDLRVTRHLAHRVPLQLGPFRITPYLADHSAFDAYSLLVEADGRRLFYTADVRGHGRKNTFEQQLDDPPDNVDVVLMEGTRILPSAADPALDLAPTESDVEDRCVELFGETDGIVLACFSPQNIDRLVSLCRAAKRTRRLLVMDLYTAGIARATGRPHTIPQADWDGVRVFVPQSQRIRIKRTGEVDRAERIRLRRVFPDQLAVQRNSLVLGFRGSMCGDVARAGCLAGARAIWSMWRGYLDQPSGQDLARWLAERSIPLHLVHSSEHATPVDLMRLATALRCQRVVPIHTAAPLEYGDVFEGVELRQDGEWWPV